MDTSKARAIAANNFQDLILLPILIQLALMILKVRVAEQLQ